MKLVSGICLAILALCSASALAQPDPGDVGVFFTDHPTSGADAARLVAGALERFDFYVVSFDVPDSIWAYQFELDLPPGLVVAGGRIMPPGGQDWGDFENFWIVSFGGDCIAAQGEFTLVHYAGALFLTLPGNDLPICLSGGAPLPLPIDQPTYVVCGSNSDVRAFGNAYEGCAMINPSAAEPPVSSAQLSYGALKARY